MLSYQTGTIESPNVFMMYFDVAPPLTSPILTPFRPSFVKV